MCGIAGVVNHPGTKSQHVLDMVRAIYYRGRDEIGVRDLGRTVLGHARLSVVDPQNGTQPMCNTDGTVWVVFNGEIYNYVELREDLKKQGYVFKSRCDTEVLVHLWREMGPRMLEKLVGMYAFFIWDSRDDRGMLARDRVGIKPCFYTRYEGGYAFCSEIKGLLALPGVQVKLNSSALVHTLAFNYCPPPQTCFANINSLEPGTYLLFEGEKSPTVHRYWCWPLLEERRRPDFEEFSALMDDAVRMQMRFDVKGGMYLSGGIDSSVVGAHLIKQWKEKSLEAVGLDFAEREYSEYDYALTAAEKLKINISRALIDHSIIPQIAQDVVHHAEQPHGDFSFFLFFLLGRQAHREGKIVMFSGDGPDEALFGFNHNVEFFSQKQRLNFPLKSYFDIICYMDLATRERLIQPDLLRDAEDPLDRFESIIEPWRELEPIEQIIAYECTSLMPGNNLVKGDRMGAAWSIEGRSPFLDHRVLELFTRLPLAEKIHDGVGKKYLKNYAARIFPQEFVYGKKRMPTTPVGEWLKGPLYGWAHDILSQEKDGILQHKAAMALLEEHRKGIRNNTRPLRIILMLKLWLSSYFP